MCGRKFRSINLVVNVSYAGSYSDGMKLSVSLFITYNCLIILLAMITDIM